MTVKAALDRSNPNTLPDHLRLVHLGRLLRGQLTQARYGVTPALDAAQLGTLHQIGLPDDARAWALVRAYARAGTGTKGELTIVATNVTPGAGEIGVAPNGDIVVLAADAWTKLDLVYTPIAGDVVTLTDYPVVSDVLTPPAALTTTPGILYCIDANVTAGTLTGRKIILAPAAGAPATTKARLDLAKATLQFAAADAVTKATVRFLVAPADSLHTVLEGSETTV